MPKLSFLRENNINHNYGEFLDFHEVTLYMIFANFLKNFENNVYGEFVKNWEFTLVMTYVIFSQKWQLGLKNESFEISPNSP